MSVDTWECMPLTFTVVAIATVLAVHGAPAAWLVLANGLTATPGLAWTVKSLGHRQKQASDPSVPTNLCRRNGGRSRMLQILGQGSLDQGGEGFSDWSIQEEPSSQATLAVILLGDPFSPLSFFFFFPSSFNYSEGL